MKTSAFYVFALRLNSDVVPYYRRDKVSGKLLSCCSARVACKHGYPLNFRCSSGRVEEGSGASDNSARDLGL